jgi:hypothetical protein
MKKTIRIAVAGFFLASGVAVAQVANDADGLYDSTTLVDTNNNSTSTSTVNSTSTNTNTNNNVNTTTVDSNSTNTNTNINTSTSVNTNNNINSGEQTFNNNNVNTTTSTNTNNNNNVNTSTSTSTNTNNNNNVNSSTSTNTNSNNNVNQNIQSGTVTNINKNENKTEQTIKSPPPTAVAPAMMSGGNSDLCTTGTSGAVQTQILGVSSGGTIRDKNCERLKNAKVLYDMGMKVAAVATLCQDRRVFDAMWHAGTPCPFDGEIGAKAKAAWAFPDRVPKPEEEESDPFYKKSMFGALLGYLLFIL